MVARRVSGAAAQEEAEAARRVERAGYQPIVVGLHLVYLEALDDDVLRVEFPRLEPLIEEFGTYK